MTKATYTYLHEEETKDSKTAGSQNRFARAQYTSQQMTGHIPDGWTDEGRTECST